MRSYCTQQIKTFSCMKFHTHPMANALLINSLLNLIKEIYWLAGESVCIGLNL